MAKLSDLISHRFRGFAPHENTIAGLNAALDFGVQQVEFDIRVTRCGTPLIYHDEAARDGRGKLRHICDILASDLQNLGGTFSHMPTAEALFAAAAAHENPARLLIDMKDAGFEDMLVALAKAEGLTDRILWVSWLPETLYAVRDLLPDAKLCLSHWCAKPSAQTRKLHKVFHSPNGHLPRPDRRSVHGERSGWFVEQPLQGDMRALVSAVCVPRAMVTRALVENYQADGIEVSAFSYVTRECVEAAEDTLGLDAFFIDDKIVFDSFA
jgi:hypothetical protein